MVHYRNILLKTRVLYLIFNNKSRYLRFACIYTKIITNENYLKKLLKDEDIESRKLLYIIHENLLYDIVDNHSVQDVIEILYNGDMGT